MVLGSVQAPCPRCGINRWTAKANLKSPCQDCLKEIRSIKYKANPNQIREHPDLLELDKEMDEWYPSE